MSTNVAKAREIALSVVVPALRKIHPDGIVTRREVMAEIARAGIPNQPWLMENIVAGRRGVYDIRAFFETSQRAGYSYEVRDDALAVEDSRTDAEVDAYVSDKFATQDRMALGIASGDFRALILSGPPGIGKTWGVERILEAARSLVYDRMSVYGRATGLFRKLFEHRDSNHVLLIDDCDSIFSDDVSLSLLKAACDSSGRRHLQWNSEKEFEDELGNEVEKHFEYHGRIIFVTNVNFERMASASAKLAPHLEAMMSRSFYLDVNLTARETLARVMSVARLSPILGKHDAKEKERILSYVRENHEKMREVSLRSLVKLSQVLSATRVGDAAKWQADFLRISNATLLRR